MCTTVFLLCFVSQCFGAQGTSATESERWEQQARNITIIRDDWGIAHVYGKTDADAVFGVMYAQAEDDFNRVETNYINAMGRLAEAEGESRIYQDLRMKLFIDPANAEEAICGQPGVAEEADERFRRRPELLPVQASGSEAAGHSAIRAMDGAQLHRRQHRRRHRAVNLSSYEAFYGKAVRRDGATTPEAIGERGALGIERHRHRALQHRRASRAAADQSAHLFLLPLRVADGERRRTECLRRRDLGPVLHLSGIQRPRRLDAHHPAVSMRSMSIWKRWRRKATASTTSTGAKSVR